MRGIGAKLERLRKPEKFSDWFTLGLAVLLLLVAAGLAVWSGWRVATYRRAQGSAVPVAYGSKGSTYYKINFAAGGHGHTIEEKVWTGMSAIFGGNYRPGESLEILYPSDAPEKGVVNTFSNLWSGPVVIGAMALLLLLCVYLQASMSRRAAGGESGRTHPTDDPDLTAEELLELDRRQRRPEGGGRAKGSPGRSTHVPDAEEDPRPCPFCGAALPGYADACPRCKKVLAGGGRGIVPSQTHGGRMARKRTRTPEADTVSDPLGKPLARYGTGMKVLLFLFTGFLLAGCGGVLMGAAERIAYRLAGSNDGGPYTFVAWGLVVIAMGTAAHGAFHFRRSFEVRRHGVRFRRRQSVLELRWSEISLIEVFKTNVYHYRTKQRTDWEIFIHGTHGTIHLTKAFLHLVPSVVGLVSLLKMHSGQEISLPLD